MPGLLRHLLADRLISMSQAAGTKDWMWFEDVLAYDNARLPQALIVTGISTGVPAYVDAGLRSLALAHEGADGTIGLFQTRRLG